MNTTKKSSLEDEPMVRRPSIGLLQQMCRIPHMPIQNEFLTIGPVEDAVSTATKNPALDDATRKKEEAKNKAA